MSPIKDNCITEDINNKTVSDSHNFIWFRVAKVATRSIKQLLEESTNAYETKKYTTKQFNNYFKFAFVRNPWDRLVSCYANKIIRKRLFQECHGKDFKYFINFVKSQDLKSADRHIRLQSSLFPVNKMDFIGRFENLEKDFKTVCKRIGLRNVKLPHKHKTEHEHYSKYYDDETRLIVEKKYVEDIKTFNYTFK